MTVTRAGLAGIIVMALSVIVAQADVSVTNYSWLQLAPSAVTPLVGGYQVVSGSSANGSIGDFRWGNFVWVPNNQLTWNSSTSSQSQYWGAVNLGKPRLVTQVRVQPWASTTETLRRFYIDGSNTGSNNPADWTQIGSFDYGSFQSAADPGAQLVNTTDGTYQYVRARFEPGDYTAANQSVNGSYGGPGLWMVEPIGNGTIVGGEKVNYANIQNFSTTQSTNILGPPTPHSDNRTGGGRSYLHGTLQDSSYVSGYYEGFGGNMVAGEYFQVNLNGSRKIDEVIAVAAGGYSPKSFTVEFSTNNGLSFNPVTLGLSAAAYYPFYGGTNPENAAGATGYTFDPLSGVTNIRLTNGVVNGGGYWLIDEIEVLGTLPVPEPSGLALLALGGLALFRRRR